MYPKSRELHQAGEKPQVACWSPVERGVGMGLINEMIKDPDLQFLCSDLVRCREDPLGGCRAQERLEDGWPGHGVLLEPDWRSLEGHPESSNS